MKNLHVLPTDKPSVLILRQDRKLFFTGYGGQLGKIHGLRKDVPQNIYITNDEQLKHNDYYTTDGKEIYYCNTLNPTRNNHYKKVILTTDQDLIGVQGIDDEFLEWFVQNPTCEEVEVFKERYHGVEFIDDYPKGFFDYKIIIPQVEPNLETIAEIGKFAERKYLDRLNNFERCDFNDGVFEGVKWQQDQDKNKYSEEEVFSIIDKAFHMYASSHRHDAKEWFEKFKNKNYERIRI